MAKTKMYKKELLCTGCGCAVTVHSDKPIKEVMKKGYCSECRDIMEESK